MLLTRNQTNGEDWYTLPGGGQEKFATLEEAVQRECMEETGYAIRVLDRLFVRADISNHHEFAATEPDGHQIALMFRCELASGKGNPTISVPDSSQVGVAWVKIAELESIALYPKVLARHILKLRSGAESPKYWGDVNET